MKESEAAFCGVLQVVARRECSDRSLLMDSTLARLMARTANADFKELSATSSGTADVRQVFEQAKNGLLLTGR